MYLLDADKLEVGDIILVRSSSRLSQLIRKVTQSQYSHAILYVGAHSIIDSDGYGVQANNIQRLLIENIDDAKVLRLKGGHKYLNKVEEFARQKIGTEYSEEEAKLAAIREEFDTQLQNPNRQFCTRFIAQSYQNAGIKLVENPDYCVPEELWTSEKLTIIDKVLRKATKKDIDFAKSDNPLEKQKDMHNAIFQEARRLSGVDVQNFEQFIKLVIEKPQYDSDLTDFVSRSGYLNLMELDMQKNPQHYDGEKMISYYKHPETIVNAAKSIIKTEIKIRERYYMTLNFLEKWYKVYPRKYLKMEIELYKKLIKYSELKETEAVKVLEKMDGVK